MPKASRYHPEGREVWRSVEKLGENGNNYGKICVFETNPYLCKCNKKNI